jgi:hypothetical protein
MSINPAIAAASAFSSNIRLYSVGEHLFSAISSARRVTVSHDATISSAIIAGRDVLRGLRAFIMNGLPPTLQDFQGIWWGEIRIIAEGTPNSAVTFFYLGRDDLAAEPPASNLMMLSQSGE